MKRAVHVCGVAEFKVGDPPPDDENDYLGWCAWAEVQRSVARDAGCTDSRRSRVGSKGRCELKCGTHPDYLVPGCEDCLRAGYLDQIAKDQDAIRAALDIESGLTKKTIDFLESLGRWSLDEGRCFSFAQRRKLDQILNEY